MIRVAAALDSGLAHMVLSDLRLEGPERWRLRFDGDGHGATVVVSLRLRRPWIGRPAVPRERHPGVPLPFLGEARRALVGRRLERVEKWRMDRILRLSFAGGAELVVELLPQSPNLVLLDDGQRIVARARRPRRSREADAEHGQDGYRPPSCPPGLRLAWDSTAEEIDRVLREAQDSGEEPTAALMRRFLGVGAVGAELVVREAGESGRGIGETLLARFQRLERGDDDPLLVGPPDPLGAARQGTLDPTALRLLPWRPPWIPPHAETDGADPARLAGRYHEALDLDERRRGRAVALRATIDRELRRVGEARAKAAADLAGFVDPERHRRRGEALLAGMSRARIEGDSAFVPDPYDPQGREIAVPISPGRTLAECAQAQFQAYRRAVRGQEQASRREVWLASRHETLEELAVRAERDEGTDALDDLQRELQASGLALERSSPAGGGAGASRPAGVAGVRSFRGPGGETILAGRGARENHRLTFKLAGPEDFWFHALGARGAHVVLRNERGTAQPDPAALRAAAAIAAWLSESRSQPAAEVQWTRRKFVRKPRSAPPGTVVIKKFQTIRVHPRLPDGAEELV